MSDIRLVRSHSLPITKAKALVQKTIDGLASEYDLNSEWHGDTLHVHRLGVNGQAHVTNSEIRLHVTLGFLLKPFRAKFVEHIEHSFNRLLPKREPERKTARTAE